MFYYFRPPPQVLVQDVNDNPPFVSSSLALRLSPQGVRSLPFNLSLDDPDDWTAGNGPPFQVVQTDRQWLAFLQCAAGEQIFTGCFSFIEFVLLDHDYRGNMKLLDLRKD